MEQFQTIMGFSSHEMYLQVIIFTPYPPNRTQTIHPRNNCIMLWLVRCANFKHIENMITELGFCFVLYLVFFFFFALLH